MYTKTLRRLSLLVGMLLAVALVAVPVAPPAFAEEASGTTSSCAVGSNSFAQCLPDANLRKTVMGTLKISDEGTVITQAHVHALTSLDARNAGIADLTGLGVFSSLERLWLYNNNISDLGPLSSLANLQDLGLGDNDISDISALSGLTKLTTINLAHNSVASIDPLASAKNLEYLWASSNQLTNVDVINNFTHMKGADLSRNKVFSAANIKLDPPKYLVMTGQVIEYDITVDFGATFSVDTPIGYDGKHIQPMSIANNGTYDASTGKITWKADQYSGIGLVAVYQSQGGGQSGDRPFSGIVRANVTHTGAENVEPEDTATPPAWREAPAGTEATKTTCQEGTSTFAQCFPDAALATAVSKELGSTSSDVVAVGELGKVTKLLANNTGIKVLSGVEHLVNLRSIHMSDNPISDISPLASLSKLYDVQFYNDRVVDVSALANKPDLWGLGLGNNYIEDISTITNVPKLAWVDIYSNNITDFSIVRQWPTLNALWVSGNPFTDVSPIADVKGLRRLQLESNGIDDMSAFQKLEPTEYSMNDGQSVWRDPVTVNAGATVSVRTAKGRMGQYLTPKNISPAGGTYNPATGTVTWTNVSRSGKYSFTFSESDNWDYLFSGKVRQPVTVNQTDKTAPVITGVYDTYSTIDQPYDWMDGVKATDDVDGDITDRIQIPKNTLDIHKLGTYAIQYYVEDNAQNKTWSGRKVTVTNATLDSLISYSVTTKVGTAPTLPVYAKATWSDGKTSYEGVTWESVPAEQYNKAGSFIVQGTSRGKKVTTTVYVEKKDIPINSVAINGDQIVSGSLQLNTQAKATLKASTLPADAKEPTITWSVKDTSIASVDQKGTVTAIKPGTTEVIATADDKTASVKLTVRQRFTDVPPSALFASDIDWLTSVRITQGNSNGTYGYGQTLRRQDMAIFLYRFAKLQNIGSASTFKPSAKDYAKFKDVKKGSFAATEILWLASTGITQGNPDGTFRGTNKLNRQDMAVFLHRMYTYLRKS